MKKTKNITSILVSIQMSSVLLLVLLNLVFDVTSFNDRIMGNGPMFGIDISKRINMFYIFIFLLIPSITIYLSLFFKDIFSNIDKSVLRFIDIISVLGIVNILFGMIDYFYDNFSPLSILVLQGINLTIILHVLYVIVVI